MIIVDKLRDWWEENINFSFSPGPRIRRLIWGVIFIIILALILTVDLVPARIDMEAGDVSQSDITAPRTVTYVDQERTQELKRTAAQSAPRVYEENKNANNKIKEDIRNVFNVVIDKKSAQENDAGEKKDPATLAGEIKSEGLKLEEETIKLLLATDTTDLRQIEERILTIMDRQLEDRVLPGDIPEVEEKLAADVDELNYKPQYRDAMKEILTVYLRPNMSLDEEASKNRQQEAMEQIEPVKRTVRQGEVIVRQGDVVTEEDIKVLQMLGLQKRRVNYLNITGIILVLLILIASIAYYFRKYREDIWQANNKLLLLEILVVVIVIMARIISIFQSAYLMYLVPVAAASILTTVLIGTDTALILTVFLSFLVALIFNNSYSIALIGFISGIVGIFSVSRVSQRNDLVRAGFNVSAVLVFLVFAINLLQPVNSWINILKTVSMGVVNGVLVAIFANGLLPYLENGFDLTSSVKLLELSNPSQPLLKRLLVEAPGTYHHSVIVGNLAETAADDIGADSLLARVGAYYHDIGKLKRPYFFTDNQFGGENPHDKISPNLSSLIIKSHVKDGVEMARENDLPGEVREIIKQHHGTNLISFFYQQAVEDSKHDTVEKNEFCYDGPRPRSREAAIIMLADVVEAAIRSKNFNKNDHNRIEGLVRELIREKLINNQLDNSELTLNDLDVIAASFVKVLTGIYHHRIEYPEKIIEEIKRDDRDD